MADIQVSDPATRLRDNVATVATGDDALRRVEEQAYLTQYAAALSNLDPSRGFEIR